MNAKFDYDHKPITAGELREGRGLTETPDPEDGGVWRDAWVHTALLRAADTIEILTHELNQWRTGQRQDD